MSQHLAKSVSLEQTPEENLADDSVFVPSPQYDGKLVGIAIKNGRQVCWCCFEPLGVYDGVDAIMGTALIRICQKNECGQRVGEVNADRAARERQGAILQLGDLTEDQRIELVNEIQRKKKEIRGR